MHTHLATFLFQVVNFLILVGVLRFWLFRPVQAMIDRRQREIEAPLAEAATERSKATQLRAEAERQHLAAAGERERYLLEARRDAEAQRDQLVANARRAADDLVKAGQETLARERAAVESRLQEQAATLAVGLAARLLAASGADGATDHLLDEALRAVESLGGPARDGIERATGPARVQIVSALPVETVRRDAVARRLHRSLGDALEVTFAEDPALIAGVEIHLPTAVVRQSWREQLALAQKELVVR